MCLAWFALCHVYGIYSLRGLPFGYIGARLASRCNWGGRVMVALCCACEGVTNFLKRQRIAKVTMAE